MLNLGEIERCSITCLSLKVRCGALAAIAAFALAACAKTPDSIPPAYVSEMDYQSSGCTQLAAQNQKVTEQLAVASKKQQSTHNKDAVGILLLGLPVSSMSGEDVAPEIASLKGQQQAIRKQQAAKGCA